MHRFAMVVYVVLLAFSTAAAGHRLPTPNGPVVLTVEGDIAQTNAEGAANFDLTMLEELGIVTMRTTTAWTVGSQEFEGPLLRDLLKAVGANGSGITAIALNDYKVEIPIEDGDAYRVILAIRHNGQPMRIRDKGPIWIVYPVYDHPELNTAEYRSRMIWQLRRLIVH